MPTSRYNVFDHYLTPEDYVIAQRMPAGARAWYATGDRLDATRMRYAVSNPAIYATYEGALIRGGSPAARPY